jgi:pyroglutamyl-peptidase
MTIILTGFTPFGDFAVNPSQLIVEQIAAENKFADLVTAILPVAYHAVGRRVRELIRMYRPDAILCLGLAARRNNIYLERVALNLNDAPIADNAGDLASGRIIDPDGPLAYGSTLPLDDIVVSLRSRNLPAAISNHAGTYVCNHVFYAARRELDCMGSSTPCGFIHLPLICETGDETTGLPLATMVEAVECCLRLLGAS